MTERTGNDPRQPPELLSELSWEARRHGNFLPFSSGDEPRRRRRGQSGRHSDPDGKVAATSSRVIRCREALRWPRRETVLGVHPRGAGE